jgi:MFS family permease
MISKNNLLFFISIFFSRLADNILLFLVPLVVYKITKSASISGLAFFIESLPRFMWFPIAGILTSYISPYKLLNISQIMRFIIVILGLLGYYFFESFYWLIAISSIVGILTTQGEISREVIIPQFFKKFPLQKVFSITQLSDQLGMVFAPLLAVLLLSYTTWEVIVLFTGFLFLISDVFLKLWWRKSKYIFNVKNLKNIKIIDDIKTSLHNILILPKLMPLIVIAFSVNLILGTLISSLVPIFTGNFEQSQNAYATLQVLGIFVTIVVLLITSKFTFKLRIMGLLSFMCISIGGILTGLTDILILYVIGYILIVGFDKMFNIYIRTIRTQIIPEKDFGKTLGLIVLFNNISQPIAGLIIAIFADNLGIQRIVFFISTFAFILGISVLIKYKMI